MPKIPKDLVDNISWFSHIESSFKEVRDHFNIFPLSMTLLSYCLLFFFVNTYPSNSTKHMSQYNQLIMIFFNLLGSDVLF